MTASSVTLEMGGFTCAILSGDQAITEPLTRRYQGFFSTDPPDFTLTTMIMDGAARQDGVLEIQSGAVAVGRSARRLTLTGSGFWAECDLDLRTGTIVQPLNLSPLDVLLKAIYSHYLSYEDACFVHGCAIQRQGRGFLFFGPSGSGKSTMAKIAGEGVLADELVILRRRERSYELHGTPFWGGSNSTAPLTGLFALSLDRRAETDTLLTPAQTVRRLLPCMGNFIEDAACQARLLALASSVAQTMPCRQVQFSTTASMESWAHAHFV
ncbi:MAG TPA: hypothetical protein VLY45_00735 [Nitrospiria bacterium]|nr:hypothetical protein [Nitrospiria bacterium]